MKTRVACFGRCLGNGKGIRQTIKGSGGTRVFFAAVQTLRKQLMECPNTLDLASETAYLYVSALIDLFFPRNLGIIYRSHISLSSLHTPTVAGNLDKAFLTIECNILQAIKSLEKEESLVFDKNQSLLRHNDLFEEFMAGLERSRELYLGLLSELQLQTEVEHG